MGIKTFSLENFKGYEKKCTIEIPDLLVLSGVNNRGKSSIYQALLLLDQSIESNLLHNKFGLFPTLNLNGEHVKLGLEKDLLHDINDHNITFGLEYDNNTNENLKFTLHDNVDLKNGLTQSFILTEYSFEALHKNIKLVVNNNKISIEARNSLNFESVFFRELFLELVQKQIPNKKTYELVDPEVVFENVSNVIFQERILRQFTISFEDLRFCLFEDFRDLIDWSIIKKELCEQVKSVDNIVLINAVEYVDISEILDHSVDYINAFRGFPKYLYNELEDKNPLNKSKLDKITSYGYDFDKNEVITGSYSDAMQFWIVDQFNLMDGFEVKKHLGGIITQNLLTMNDKPIPMNHIGFGINQIIPVITEVLFSNSEYIIIDEPEIHLHPSMQSKLADFFVSMMMCGKKIIVETHSEYLIQKLIYLLIFHDIESHKQGLYWINCLEFPYLNSIEYDELGFIKNKPIGFIDENQKLAKLLSELRLKKLKDDK